jgi:hypothetical protein
MPVHGWSIVADHRFGGRVKDHIRGVVSLGRR